MEHLPKLHFEGFCPFFHWLKDIFTWTGVNWFFSALQTAASFQGDTNRGDSNYCLLAMDSEAKGINSWSWDFFMLFFHAL